PRALDHWQESADRLDASLQGVREKLRPIAESADLTELHGLLEKFETKLNEFDAALAEEPRHIDHARAEFLEMLARYAQQLALRIVEVIRESVLAYSSKPGLLAAHQQLLDVASALLARSEERSRRTWDKQFAWAAAEGIACRARPARSSAGISSGSPSLGARPDSPTHGFASLLPRRRALVARRGVGLLRGPARGRVRERQMARGGIVCARPERF